MNESTNSFLFDSLYGEKLDETAHSIKTYSELYDLKVINYKESVTDGFFDYVKQKKFFVVVAIYDEHKRFLLERVTGDEFGWTLPGGSVHKNESIFEAVQRNAKNAICGLILGEIEPVAIITNHFFHNNSSFDHFGLVFLARARMFLDQSDSICKFVKITEQELQKVKRHANKQALEVCAERVTKFETRKQDNEIEANELAKSRYIFHKLFVKRFFLTRKRKRSDEQMSLISKIVGNKKNIIDVSCGDSSWPQSIIARNPTIEVFFANDISWSQVELGATSSPKIKYSNHDAQYLPFRTNAFDLAICMNTLHHMPTREHLLRLIRSIDRISKTVLIWEIMNPKHDKMFWPRWLNKYYYEGFLKDQGVAYFGTEQFRELMRVCFPTHNVEFGQFVNLQGTYNYAIVNRNMSAELEVEEKFWLNGEVEISQILSRNSFLKSNQEHQTDTYFSDPEGNFVRSNTCLRIRKGAADASATVDYKGPSSDLSASIISKVERNVRLAEGAESSFSEVLSALGFCRHIVVSKSRQTYTKNIHDFKLSVAVDAIEGVGSFIELEITTADHTKSAQAEELLLDIKRNLAPILGKSVTIPYRDLVAKHKFDAIFGHSTKAIAFDFDGTIIPNTNKLFYDAWNEVSSELYGYKINYDEYHDNEVEGTEGLFQKIVERLQITNTREDYFKPIYERYLFKLKDWATSGDLEKFFKPFQILEGRYKLALVTHSRKEFVDVILDRCNASRFFDLILCREDLEGLKPDPAGYMKVIQAFGVNPDELLVVEDSKKGIEAGIAAGARVVLIGNDFSAHRTNASMTVSSCTELILLSLAECK